MLSRGIFTGMRNSPLQEFVLATAMEQLLAMPREMLLASGRSFAMVRWPETQSSSVDGGPMKCKLGDIRKANSTSPPPSKYQS